MSRPLSSSAYLSQKPIGNERGCQTDKYGVDNNLPGFALVFGAEFRLLDAVGFADIAKIK